MVDQANPPPPVADEIVIELAALVMLIPGPWLKSAAWGVPAIAPIITCPSVIELDHEGTPDELDTNAALFTAVISPTTLLEELNRILFITVVGGYVAVLQEGIVEEPDKSTWFAVEVPANIAPVDPLE